MRHFCSLTLLVAATWAIGACAQPPVACGVYRPGGGPAEIRTRDQQLCELVRQRVLQYMATEPELTLQASDELANRAARWHFADTLDELIAKVRRDAGDRLAELVGRAVASVRASDAKPLPADCPDVEACLVRGAALGAELALVQRGYYVSGGRPKGDAVSPNALRAIDIDDLSD